MTKAKKSWDLLPKEKKEKAVQALIHFFESERGEKIGVIAAGDLLDHFLQVAGMDIYNQALEKSQEFLIQRHEDLLVDIEFIKKGGSL